MISSGVSVPYSDEYRELRSNPAALETIASLTDGELTTWKSRPDGRPDLPRTLSSVDHFRRDPNLVVPRAYRDLWPNLLWGACRPLPVRRRRAPGRPRLRPHAAHRRRPVEEAPRPGGRPAGRIHGEAPEPQGRGRRAARPLPRRHPVRADAGTAAGPVDEPLLTGTADAAKEPPKPKPAGPGLGPDEKKPEPESYTNRLLRAKQKVWEDREKDKK